MKYLIHTQDPVDEHLGALLEKELSANDIRAEVTKTSDQHQVLQHIKSNAYDHFTFIGSKMSNRLRREIKRQNILCGFLPRTIHAEASKAHPFFDTVYSNLPGESNHSMYKGNALLELCKVLKNRITPVEEEGATIALIRSRKGPGKEKLLNQMLDQSMPNIQWVWVYPEEDLMHTVAIVASANAAIVFDAMSELVALALNCPLLRINQPRFFKKNSLSLINRIAQKGIVKVLRLGQTDLLSQELVLIMNDPMHCAGMMQDFQEVKQLLGTEPAIRNIARDIIERVSID